LKNEACKYCRVSAICVLGLDVSTTVDSTGTPFARPYLSLQQVQISERCPRVAEQFMVWMMRHGLCPSDEFAEIVNRERRKHG